MDRDFYQVLETELKKHILKDLHVTKYVDNVGLRVTLDIIQNYYSSIVIYSSDNDTCEVTFFSYLVFPGSFYMDKRKKYVKEAGQALKNIGLGVDNIWVYENEIRVKLTHKLQVDISNNHQIDNVLAAVYSLLDKYKKLKLYYNEANVTLELI